LEQIGDFGDLRREIGAGSLRRGEVSLVVDIGLDRGHVFALRLHRGLAAVDDRGVVRPGSVGVKPGGQHNARDGDPFG